MSATSIIAICFGILILLCAIGVTTYYLFFYKPIGDICTQNIGCDPNINGCMITSCKSGATTCIQNDSCKFPSMPINVQMNLKTPDGLCMDVAKNDLESARFVGVWDCNGLPGQKFTYNADRTISVFNTTTNTKFCLNVDGGINAIAPGTSVWVFNCLDSTNTNQYWTFNVDTKTFSPDNAPHLNLTQHGKWNGDGSNNLTIEVPSSDNSQKWIGVAI